MNTTDTASIGDNRPPEPQLLREQLIEKYDQLLRKRAKELADQLDAIPDPLPDDKLEEASELIKSSQTFMRKIDAARQTEKEPYLEAGRAVDAYFGSLSKLLSSARDRARPIYEKAHDLRGGGKILTDHGVVATQTETWDFLITDRAKLPKLLLWKYISREAIDAAIKAAIQNGVREMKGVDIFPRKKSVIR